jgi:hypothetical protein
LPIAAAFIPSSAAALESPCLNDICGSSATPPALQFKAYVLFQRRPKWSLL